ncbi:MAG TPA: hypothetical protein PLD27_00440 [bacterium]|nr:hypothetical protein [bacterium]HOL47232.1 hypothetical protein [bacterium]HPQ18259.1 hypothetical protein [bacterium]
MIKNIFKYFYKKNKIVNLYNKINSNLLNIILKICNEKNPQNLKEIINKYLIIDNSEIENNYKKLSRYVKYTNNVKAKRVKEISDVLFEVSLLLQSIHKKIIAYQIEINNEFITVFIKIKNFLDGINVIINNTLNNNEIKIENKEIAINEIEIAKNKLIEKIKNYPVEKYLKIIEIISDIEKIIKIIEKI